MMTTTYTTWGSIRRGCGHYHPGLAAALDCVRRDNAVCRAQGGYSDRGVRRGDLPWIYEGSRRVPARLTNDEQADLDSLAGERNP